MGNGRNGFISPELYHNNIRKRNLEGPNGWLLFVACNEGLDLADAVKTEYDALLKKSHSRLPGIPLLNNNREAMAEPHSRRLVTRFEDNETCPWLPQHVGGSDAFVFQYVHELKSGNTPNENFFQLLQLVRTLKVSMAHSITAVTPYSHSSRQDKPTPFKREATLAKLNADLLTTAGITGALVYHLHSEGIRGFYEPAVRFTALNGLDLFIDIGEPFKGMKDVSCVSTDAGGAKFTIHYAKAMELDYAIGNKYRPEKEKADILGIIGNINGKRTALLGDDESVSFTSLYNTIKELFTRYSVQETIMLVSHNKIRGSHIEKIRECHEKYGLKELHVTDTLPQTEEILALPFVRVHSLAQRLALTINRLHYNQSVSELFYKPKKN